MERCYICKLDVTSAHIVEHELSDTHNFNLKICNEGNERLKDHANRRGVINTLHKAGTFYCDICNDVIEVNKIVHKASAAHETNRTQIQNVKSLYEAYTNNQLKKVDKNNTLQQYLHYLNVCHEIKHLRANGNQYVMMTGVNGDKVNIMSNMFHSIQTGADGNVNNCILCNKEISVVDDHLVESEHIKNIKEPAPDKHCIIKCVDRNLDYCLLCNVLMPYTQKSRHIEEAGHKANVEKALVWENKGQSAANYSHHISDGPDGKGIKKYCLVCRVEVPDNIRNIEGHVAGTKHKSNFKDILDINKLVVTKDKYLCGICDCTVLEADVFNHVDSTNHKHRLSNPAPKKNAEIYEPGTECTLCKVDVSGLNKVEHKLGFIHQSKIKKTHTKSQPDTVAIKEKDSKTKAKIVKILETKSSTNSVESDIDSDDCTIGVIKKNLKSIKIPEIPSKNLEILKEREDERSNNCVGMSLLELESYINLITLKYPAKHKLRVINEKFLEVTAANGDEVILTIEKFHTFSVLSGMKKCLVCYNLFQSTYHHMHSTEHMRNIMIDIMDKHCVRNSLAPHNYRVSFCLHCLTQMDKEDCDIHKTTEAHKKMLDLALFTPKRVEINNTPTLKIMCYPQNGNFSSERTKEKELDHQLKKTMNPKEVLCKICNVTVPNVESNIRSHLNGARHDVNKKQFLTDNNIATFVTDYECKKCLSFVEATNLFDHINSHSIKQSSSRLL